MLLVAAQFKTGLVAATVRERRQARCQLLEGRIAPNLPADFGDAAPLRTKLSGEVGNL